MIGREEQKKQLATRFGNDIPEANTTSKISNKVVVTRAFHSTSFDYESGDHIGSGTFGDVYLVKHKVFKKRKFAVKRFRKECPAKLAWKELYILQYLKHANILIMYGAFVTDVPSLVLQACYGE